ncbi:unnamed protein product [Linum tenue]|uniref:Uncharacterized protein n=1 Tax=Linum tenue TaxID=586396 RepID=A0AAV0MT15_9ROSI|nr:unnamed protein product [Linum tenue]
MRAALKQRP